MNHKELTEEEVFEVTRGSLQIDPGLYLYRNRENEEDPAWKQMNHFIYWDGNAWLWSVDYDGSHVWFGIKPSSSYHETRTVSRERFFDFAKERTPDMLDWILFNLISKNFP
jgi:hypothetical protein